MKTKVTITFLILGVFFLMLFLVNIWMYYHSYIFTFESWTPIHSGILLFSLSGLNFFVFLLLALKHPLLKTLCVIVAFISFVFLFFLGTFTAETVKIIVVKEEGYTLYVRETRFLFSGTDYFYLEDNLLWAHFIAQADQSEECNSIYYIENGYLHITEYWESGTEKTFTVKLN